MRLVQSGLVMMLFTATGCSLSQSQAARKFVVEVLPKNATDRAKNDLAMHLTKSGAKMYGTFWCPYCERQRGLFGKFAHKLTVIECDPNGQNAQPKLCSEAGVTSFPTWQINGKLYAGMMSLDELAQASGYSGSRQFDSNP